MLYSLFVSVPLVNQTLLMPILVFFGDDFTPDLSVNVFGCVDS